MGVRVLWALIGGFLAGVFFESIFLFGYAAALFFALLALLALLFAFIDRSKQAFLLIIAVVCAAGALGVVRMHLSTRVGDPALTKEVGKAVTLEGVVSEEPDVRETNIRLTINVATIYGRATSTVRARVLAIAPLHTGAPYGERVVVTGKLALPEKFDTTLGRSFDYPRYLAKDDVLYTLSYARIVDQHENHGNPIKAFAIDAKHLFLSGLARAIPEPEAGLAGGITVGDKRSIGTELSADFQKVSLIHMVVLSGYNITVVVNAAMALLGWCAQWIRFSAAGFVVALFILMAGGASSAMRAGIMALIAIYARASHRVFLAGRVLGVVCAAMVLWNPWTLVFDPSFQLSALATLGLVLFTPTLSARLASVPARFGIREIFASTLATQAMVLPLLLYQNGMLSLLSLPANLLALVTVPAAMGLSVLAAFAGLVAGPLAPVLGFPAFVLLWYEIHVATFFASFSFAAIEVPIFNFWWVAIAYAALFGLWWRKKAAGQNPAK